MIFRAIGILALFALLLSDSSYAQSDATARKSRVLGERLFQRANFVDAVTACTLSLELDPSQADVRMLRGDAYRGLRKMNRAIADYDAALELGGNKGEILRRRSYAWWELKIYHKALEDCQAALTECPDNIHALSMRSSLRAAQGDTRGARADDKRIALWGPDWPEAQLRLGQGYMEIADYRLAIEAYDRVLMMDPLNADAWYWSGIAYLQRGQADNALCRFRELVHKNPQQKGGYSRHWPLKRDVTGDDLAHGRHQLDRLLKDRPPLATLVSPGDEIFEWAVRKFAGEDLPGRIVWDATEPTHADADHRSPRGQRPARVRLRAVENSSESPAASESLWMKLVFELHNVQSHHRFRELEGLAAAEFLSREGYVRETARLEYHALQRTRAWYLDIYQPWAEKHGIATDCREWCAGALPTFDEWIERYVDQDNYPWSPYGEHYDLLLKRPPGHAGNK